MSADDTAQGKGVNTMTIVSREELLSEGIELLPTRETLSLSHFGNVATVSATNLALASNAGSCFSVAGASANQAVLVTQL
jgi:hypothetical protein